MSTIVLRSVKGTPLTNTEVDANFSNLNTDKLQVGGTYSAGTANGVLFLNSSTVLTTGSALTFDGTNLVLGANKVIVKNAVGDAQGLQIYQAASDVSSIFNYYNGALAFGVNNTEQMRLTSTGLGIGTSSFSQRLSVAAPAGGSSTISGNFRGIAFLYANQGGSPGLRVGYNQSSNNAILAGTEQGGGAGGGLEAWTFNGSDWGERARISSSGDLTLRASNSTTTTHAFIFNESGGEIQLMNASGSTDVLFDSVAGTARYLAFNGAMSIGTIVAQPFIVSTSGVERARIDSSGNLLVGTTTALGTFTVGSNDNNANITAGGGNTHLTLRASGTSGAVIFGAGGVANGTGGTERARIDSSGNLLVGTTSTAVANGTGTGTAIGPTQGFHCSRSGNAAAKFNRTTNDGVIIDIGQDGVTEGTISVSGTTVSYNGGHLSRWAQTTTAKDESLVKGTVLSNLDEMNVYTDADGNPVENEQLNKVKVSDVEGDANVAGVFVNWTYDDAHKVDEINMAMTGDMIIRIAQGTTVQRGDLLMSAGDGTAKPQGDDIVRSKTVAKVTSTHVTCTYADGSFCVPCVLMAC